MVGEGPELPVVRELADQLGISKHISYLGKQEDVACVLSMADLLLLPSEKESFGLAALEAMACGIPVITSNAGGLPEVVEDGSTGFILPVGDVEGMAEKAILLAKNKEMYRIFSENCTHRATGVFSHEKITNQYEEIYERVIAGR